jgi:hypothetical protein
MKKLIVAVAALGLVVALSFVLLKNESPKMVGGSGTPFTYNISTNSTSTVGPSAWVTVLSADSSRGYASVCNNSILSNDAVYLAFGATTTKPLGFRLPSGNCYEMTNDKMFFGAVYSIASTASTTLLMISAGY